MRLALGVTCAVGLGCLAARPAAAVPASPQQQIALIAKPSVMRVWGAYAATYEVEGHRFTESIGGSGTGFFITADGYIATNAHVVAVVRDGDAKAKDALRRALFSELDHKFGSQLARLTKAKLTEFIAGIKLVELKKLAYVVLPNGDHLDYEVGQMGGPGPGRACA